MKHHHPHPHGCTCVCTQTVNMRGNGMPHIISEPITGRLHQAIWYGFLITDSGENLWCPCKTDPIKVCIVQIDSKSTFKPKLRNFFMVYHDGSNHLFFAFVRSSRRSARTWPTSRWRRKKRNNLVGRCITSFPQVEMAFSKFDSSGDDKLDYRCHVKIDLNIFNFYNGQLGAIFTNK